MNKRQLRFNVPSPGGRLDLTLVALIPDHSRSRLQHLIRSGLVVVDGIVVTKPGFRLEGGEAIRVLIPESKPLELQAEAIPLDVVFENADLLLVNKPAGMVVHPSAGHDTGTLVHAALAHAPDITGVGGKIRPGVVHRLDKDTSGLILLAKNDKTHQDLQKQFKEREVEKRYLALVDGHPPSPTGRVEAPIGRDKHDRKRMAVVPSGKGREAVTIYRTVEKYIKHSLLEVNPRTGRTHQIRIHMAFLGCPVVGDRVYGRRKTSLPLDRIFLHAFSLSFKLPGAATPRSFEARIPPELEIILDRLRTG